LRVVFSQTRNFTVIAFTDANMYATWMAQRSGRNGRFLMEGSDFLHLPLLSLLCAWARHLKTRTHRGQANCTSKFTYLSQSANFWCEDQCCNR